MVDVVAHVHCHLGIYKSADMTSNCPLFNTLCLIHSQKKELSESFQRAFDKNSRTKMLSGKRDFYRCCKARRSASHVNKEFWQQFQNNALPSLRVIRTKFAHTLNIIGRAK